MKTKNKIRNILIRLAVLGVLIYSTHKLVSGVGSKEDMQAGASQTSSSSLQSENSTQPSIQPNPTDLTPNTSKDSDWLYDHKENFPDGTVTYWYTPKSYTSETAWFAIDGFNVGYRLKGDAVIEFQSESEPKQQTAFRHDAESGKVYLESNGSFSENPYSSSEFIALAKNSEGFRFRPINDQPMKGLKVSKVE